MSGIRVTYSGLISFGVGISSILTGLMFILIVTRQLTAEELGNWTLIGGLLVYVLILEPVVSYWTTREIARGEESGKTALMTSGTLSVIGLGVYLLIAYLVGQNSEADLDVLFFAAILIPITFLNRTLSAINYGSKPHIVSFGMLGFEISKIPLGFVFVYFLEYGVQGVILAIAISYIVSSIILGIYGREKIEKKFSVSFIKKWFKLFWISMYPQITAFVMKIDVLVFTIIIGSVVGLAYYIVALAVSSLVIQSAGISRAIYPKLLSDDKREIFGENLVRVFYFALPLTAISLTFMRPALFALNPIYEGAVLVVLFMTLRMFLSNLFTVFYSALIGIEKVDMNEKSTFRDYMRSKLFFMPTLNIIRSIVYIVTLTIGLLVLKSESSQLDLVIMWSIIAFIIEIPFTVYSAILIRKNFVLKLDYVSIIKYAVISIGVFLPLYFITEQYLEYQTSIFDFLPNLLLYVAVGVGGYLVITYLIDEKTKKLFNAIIKEIKKENS